MRYIEVNKDLFELEDKYYLAQCISADLAMGKGIALEFNRKFNIKNKLKKRFPSGILDSDQDYETIACIKEGRVFNLVTKKAGRDKPTLYTLKGALFFLAEQCETLGIKYLGIPLLGCGLDGLDWADVRELVKEEFNALDITIEVCIHGQ